MPNKTFINLLRRIKSKTRLANSATKPQLRVTDARTRDEKLLLTQSVRTRLKHAELQATGALFGVRSRVTNGVRQFRVLAPLGKARFDTDFAPT